MKASVFLCLILLKGSNVTAEESGLLRSPSRDLHAVSEVVGFVQDDVQARSLQGTSCDEKAIAYRRCLSSLPDMQVARTCVDCIQKDLNDNGRRRPCPD